MPFDTAHINIICIIHSLSMQNFKTHLFYILILRSNSLSISFVVWAKCMIWAEGGRAHMCVCMCLPFSLWINAYRCQYLKLILRTVFVCTRTTKRVISTIESFKFLCNLCIPKLAEYCICMRIPRIYRI